jgi:nanoRNase/pAp phosphatase (c-di-AMP/oligoRNAs hydrolase)
MLAAATLEISSQPMSGTGGLLPSAVQVASLVHEEESTGLAMQMRPSLGLKVHWKWTQLENCVFVGHTNTDTDSISSAVGAASLYGGVAARAGPINAESAFVLERYGVEVPKPFLEVCKDKKVCLMDHNQKSQMTEGVDTKLIKGIIDHHAIQSGAVVTDVPIYVDIR